MGIVQILEVPATRWRGAILPVGMLPGQRKENIAQLGSSRAGANDSGFLIFKKLVAMKPMATAQKPQPIAALMTVRSDELATEYAIAGPHEKPRWTFSTAAMHGVITASASSARQ
jgi:hypothetical protein